MKKKLRSLLIVVLSLLGIAWIVFTFCVYQEADMDADMSVRSPRFNSEKSPRVLFDAGHGNFHDIHTTYAPFAMLLKNDGISLSTHENLFTERALQDIELLIIANATPTEGNTSSAFTEHEINVLKNWIQNGGSLLLIADHDPLVVHPPSWRRPLPWTCQVYGRWTPLDSTRPLARLPGLSSVKKTKDLGDTAS